jgi:non-ribosomal peptide synthetase component F
MTAPHDHLPASPSPSDAGTPSPRNATAHATIGELFAERAAAAPEAPALTDGRRTWTYRELQARAHRLADDLLGRGAGPERTVALVLPRSMELIAAELATALTGAAFLPVDPAYPAERRALMLTDAAPAVVLDDLAEVRRVMEATGRSGSGGRPGG